MWTKEKFQEMSREELQKRGDEFNLRLKDMITYHTDLIKTVTNPSDDIAVQEVKLMFTDEKTKELIAEFFSEERITIGAHCTLPNKVQVKYIYKGHTLDPEDFYVRPESYKSISTFEMLVEAIIQDTPKPNIKPLTGGNL